MPMQAALYTLILALGLVVWVRGYRKTAKLPPRDRSRGMACVPGLLLTVLAVVLFAFYWHWIVGGAVVLALAYGAYKMIA